MFEDHNTEQNGRAHIGRRHTSHFRFLLIAIALMFAVRPFVEGYAAIGLLTDIFLFLILLSGAYAFSDQGRVFLLVLVIVLSGFVLGVISYLVSSGLLEVIKSVLVAMFLACVLAIILSKVFREKEVTEDLVTGAVCAYFLMGMLWAYVFYFLALAEEDSFANLNAVARDIGPFMYFSFVTLATLGYGDIVPRTGPAQSLAALESIIGQLYLAITIARQVGVYSSQFRFKEK